MRTSRLARTATFLVAFLLTMSACRGDITQVVRFNNWLPLGTRTDTAGTCIKTTRIGTSDTSNVAGVTIILPVGQSDSLSVIQAFSPAGCGTGDTFRWLSSSASVSVTRLDTLMARITGVSSGSAVVTAVSERDSTIRLTANVTVPGGVVVPTITSISVEPATAMLIVDQAMALSVTGPYRVVVSYSNATTRVNDLSLFNCSSSNSAQVSMNSTTCLVTALAPTPAGSGVTLTYCVEGTSICDTLIVSVNPRPVISFSPVSLCFSTLTGTMASQTITMVVTGASVANVVLTSNTAGITVSGSGANWTATKTAGATVTNGSIRATLSTDTTIVAAIPVAIIATACPGTTSSIDFAPGGGTVTRGTTITLTATCVQGSDIAEACEPFWTSSSQTVATVRGNTTKTVGTLTFGVGVAATLTVRESGTTEVCTQWTLSRTTPRKCYTFVVP